MQATPRKLTWEEAEQLRAMRESFGTSFENLARIFKVGKTTARRICADDSYKTQTAWQENVDTDPTPHDQITTADVDRIHREGRWNVPIPGITRKARRTPHIDQPRYAAQNERDGYQRNPAIRAWLFYDAPWATEDAPIAAD